MANQSKLSGVCSPAAGLIGGNEDLMGQILLHFPVRSLVRFKSVSKLWHSLISDPQFCRTHTLKNPSFLIPCGLYFYNFLPTTKTIHTIDVSITKGGKSKFPTSFALPAADAPIMFSQLLPTNFTMKLVQSCNGLTLYQFGLGNTRIKLCCVCNLATGQIKFVPLPNLNVNEEIIRCSLAFDPLVDPHFKVVCVKELESGSYTYLIFSSESGDWKDTNIVLSRWMYTISEDGEDGVYCKGAIYWLLNSDWLLNPCSECCRFDVEAETLRIISTPALDARDLCVWYFGEFNGHLHFVISDCTLDTFLVFELDLDTSQWFIKYRVNIDPLIKAFPQIVVDRGSEWPAYAYSILSVVRGEKEDNSSVIITIPHRVVSYNFKSKKVEVLANLPYNTNFRQNTAYPFAPTLSPL